MVTKLVVVVVVVAPPPPTTTPVKSSFKWKTSVFVQRLITAKTKWTARTTSSKMNQLQVEKINPEKQTLP